MNTKLHQRISEILGGPYDPFNYEGHRQTLPEVIESLEAALVAKADEVDALKAARSSGETIAAAAVKTSPQLAVSLSAVQKQPQASTQLVRAETSVAPIAETLTQRCAAENANHTPHREELKTGIPTLTDKCRAQNKVDAAKKKPVPGPFGKLLSEYHKQQKN